MHELSLIVFEALLADLGWFIASKLVFTQLPFNSMAYLLILQACILGDMVTEIAERDPLMTALDVVFSAINIYVMRKLWKNRKRRGRLAALGNKARAKIAQMKRRMAERPARRVLRPVPQGN